MLKAKLKNAAGRTHNGWQIRFHTSQHKDWDGDFVGNVYRSRELQQLGYLDSYEFYFCDHDTSEMIRMLFNNQQELMKFLTHIGNELRAQATRRQKGIW